MSPLLPLAFRTRLATLRRDLSTVTNAFFGDRPPPFTTRVALGRHSRVIPSARELLSPRSARIARVSRETPDAVSIELAFDGAEGPPEFHAGQFLTLVVTLGGETLRRAYSIHTAPTDGRIAVCVKRVPDGKVSGWLVEHAKEGDTLQVLGPSGSFGLAPGLATPDRVVLIGGGSGVTPLASIARSLLSRRSGATQEATEDSAKITLLFANRRLEDIVFRASLEQLALEHPGRFEVRHVLEAPPAGWVGGVGQLDAATCERELARLEHLERAEIFLCGPTGLMDSARAALLARGVDEARIHEERFSSPGQTVAKAPTTPQPLTVHKGGKTLSVIATPGQTLLEAGLAADVAMPFSCAMGGCAACKVKLVTGEVASEEPNCLTKQERADGWVLACVSRACGPVTLLVPDEEEAS